MLTSVNRRSIGAVSLPLKRRPAQFKELSPGSIVFLHLSVQQSCYPGGILSLLKEFLTEGCDHRDCTITKFFQRASFTPWFTLIKKENENGQLGKVPLLYPPGKNYCKGWMQCELLAMSSIRQPVVKLLIFVIWRLKESPLISVRGCLQSIHSAYCDFSRTYTHLRVALNSRLLRPT